MTFITAIRSTAGIIVAADSLEIQMGAYLRWNEFIPLLQSKNTTEDDEQPLLSPREVASLFKVERIKNVSGAQKIFALHRKSLLLVAGKAELNNQPFEKLAEEIENILKTESDPDETRIKQVVYDVLKRELDKEDQDAVRSQCEYILAIRNSGENYIYLMRYLDNYNTIPPQPAFETGIGDNRKIIVTMAGSAGAASQAGRFFNDTYSCPSPIKALELAKNLTSLAVLTEELTQEIPGVGSTIYYMFLHDKGYSFVNSELDVLNCLV